MTRAAQAAGQSDPDRNVQFRRWPPAATGPDIGRVVTWHAADVPAPAMSPQRRAAERAWLDLVRVAPGDGVAE